MQSAGSGSSQGLADPDSLGSTNDWAIGYEVTLTTTLGEEVRGEVFAYDKYLNCVVLKQAGSGPGLENLSLLKVNFIKAITAAHPPKQPLDPSLPYIDPQYTKDKEERALQAAEAAASKLGVGVSRGGQHLFDTLSKTLPCKWAGKDIVVLQQVVITAPYTPNSCSAVQDQDQAALDRVRKLVGAAASH